MLFYFIIFTIYSFKDIKSNINPKLLLDTKKNEINDDNKQLNDLVKYISNSFNLKFQIIKTKKFSFQKKKESHLNISLYTSLSV